MIPALSQRLRLFLPPAIEGPLMMVVACLGFAALAGLVRYLSVRYHPFEIAFFRNLFGFAAMIPWILRMGGDAWKTTRRGKHIARASIGTVAMLTWFASIAYLPLAEAVALNFTAPMFVVLGAALFLGERFHLRRGFALALGFLGVLIVLRPGADLFTPVAALPIVSAVAVAGITLLIRSLSSTESPQAIVVHNLLYMTPLSLVPALFFWTTPDLGSLIWMMVLGGLGTLSHLAFNRALTVSEASAVMPYDFIRLPAAALIGYAAFGEKPDIYTWIGAAVIAGSSVYIARREIVVARERKAALAAAAALKSGPP